MILIDKLLYYVVSFRDFVRMVGSMVFVKSLSRPKFKVGTLLAQSKAH